MKRSPEAMHWTTEQSEAFDRLDRQGDRTAAEIREALDRQGLLPETSTVVPANGSERRMSRSQYGARAGRLLLEVLESGQGLDGFAKDPQNRARLVEAGLIEDDPKE